VITGLSEGGSLVQADGKNSTADTVATMITYFFIVLIIINNFKFFILTLFKKFDKFDNKNIFAKVV